MTIKMYLPISCINLGYIHSFVYGYINLKQFFFYPYQEKFLLIKYYGAVKALFTIEPN